MAHLDLHPGDAGRWTPCESGALDAARQAVAADAALQLRALLADVDAEKSADPAPDAPERDAFLGFRPVQSETEQQDAAALCTPGEARSAA